MQVSNRKNFITVLRFLACLLIINSHCRDIYPFYFLAVGGGHGNAIFFILSGYCLTRIGTGFFEWTKKRVLRILPTTLIVLIAGVILDFCLNQQPKSLSEGFFMYLDRYWFVWAIIIYYCIYYFVFSKKNAKTVAIALGIWAIGYALLYIFYLDKTQFSVELEGFAIFKVYFYFGIMLLGGFIRLVEKNVSEWNEKHSFLWHICIIIVTGILWCLTYMLVTVFNRGFMFQGLIHVSVFAFAGAILVFGLKLEPYIKADNKVFDYVVSPIADGTLDIYLVQVTFKRLVVGLPFPLNFVAFVALSIIGGILLNKGVTLIRNKWGKNGKTINS